MEKLRVLRGLLTICASCKNIRDQDGQWVRFEAYIEKHSEACFSHGICKSCIRELYPEVISSDEGDDDEEALHAQR